MQTFTGVYGVGLATAKKWIKSGITCIEDAIESADLLAKHDARIFAGNRDSFYISYTTVAATTFIICV